VEFNYPLWDSDYRATNSFSCLADANIIRALKDIRLAKTTRAGNRQHQRLPVFRPVNIRQRQLCSGVNLAIIYCLSGIIGLCQYVVLNQHNA